MCGEAFWKGIVVFCLAFWLGYLADNLFAGKQSEKVEIKREVLSMKPKDKEVDNPPGKPQCKKFKNEIQQYAKLMQQKSDILGTIEKLKRESAIKQLELHQQKLKDIQREIDDLWERMRSQAYLQQESEAVPNLL
jgi:hypothetical protein